MRMVRPGIDLQLGYHFGSEPVLGQHSFNRRFDNLLRFALEHFPRGHTLDPARVARMPVINLIIKFIAGKADLLSVNNDDKITRIHMISENRLVLTPENMSSTCCQPAQDLVLGIDDDPLPLDIRFLFAE